MQLWKLLTPQIAPEILWSPWGIEITNTLLGTWIAIVLLLFFLYLGTRKRDLIPSGWQNGWEWIVEFLLGLVESVSGKKKGKMFFPVVATFFLFIMVANLIDVIPGIDTIGTLHNTPATGPITLLVGDASDKFIPWFRPPTTDLNLNLAMALVSVVITQGFGFYALGAGEHLNKYFNFKALFTKGPMGIVDFFVGILEVISEIGRLISFSFRLFGNIFAGSVLLSVFAFLLPVVATVIFIPFEMFVAVIQAFVFSFLTLLFLELSTTSHSHESHEQAEEEVEGGHAREAIAAH